MLFKAKLIFELWSIILVWVRLRFFALWVTDGNGPIRVEFKQLVVFFTLEEFKHTVGVPDFTQKFQHIKLLSELIITFVEKLRSFIEPRFLEETTTFCEAWGKTTLYWIKYDLVRWKSNGFEHILDLDYLVWAWNSRAFRPLLRFRLQLALWLLLDVKFLSYATCKKLRREEGSYHRQNSLESCSESAHDPKEIENFVSRPLTYALESV